MIWTGVTASAELHVSETDPSIQAIDAVVGAVRSDAIDVSTADVTLGAGGTSVDLSADAVDGVSIESANGGDLKVGLPFASAADDGLVVDGALVYDNNNGSTTTPLVHDDGSVQILTTIDGPDAPSRYQYALDLPAGSALELDGRGGAFVVGADGDSVLSLFEPAWAVDSHGNAVATHYEVEGWTLTQVVEIDADTAYPVVADPSVKVGWNWTYPRFTIKYSKSETQTVAGVALWGGIAETAACKFIPNSIASYGCAVLLGAYWAQVNLAARSAVKDSKCLEVRYGISSSPIMMIRDFYAKSVSC